jgi:hypothetical protein
MNFTFGIITDGNNNHYLNSVIDSIEKLNIPEYEIIIVGNTDLKREGIKVIHFDESIKKAWITRKKNLITQNAKFENVVYSHDYVAYDPDWYRGYLKYGSVFKVCMNQILNFDGTRFRDWVLWPHNNSITDSIVGQNRQCIIPYEITHLSRHMYISGSFWVAKKHVMEEFPLNESLGWGDGEDVSWSMNVRQRYDFSLNTNSIVRTLKQKDLILNFADQETIEKLMMVQ